MKCPVCALDLIVVERQGIELDYCVQCHGFWFDAGELELLTQVVGAKTPAINMDELAALAITEKTRKCPRCDRAMDKVKLGDGIPVIIDRCPHLDGLWFDAGELGRTIELPATGSADSQTMLNFLGEVFSRRADKTESAGRRPETEERRPESVGRRPETAGRRPETEERRPESGNKK